MKCSVRKENNSRPTGACIAKQQPKLLEYLWETLAVHFIIQDLGLRDRRNFAHPQICNVVIFSNVSDSFRVLRTASQTSLKAELDTLGEQCRMRMFV